MMDTNNDTLPKIRTYRKVIYDYKSRTKEQIKGILDLEIKVLERLNEGYAYHSVYKIGADKTGGYRYEINLLKLSP